MSRQEDKIKEGAAQFLEEGESVLAAFIARPRGWTQSMAGSAGLGRGQQAQARAGAEDAGFELASPMALAVTQRRLLSLETSAPLPAGAGGEPKRLVSAVPLSDVDEIKVKRLLVGKVVTVTVRGAPFKLEVGAGADAKGLVEAFEQARSGAAV